ncbi:MAG: quinone-dependent dihydroorotate dehydrogenase [Saprospiraceae bacterium]|nr:quinone-dependent dihydroorotate dehydrogenase [Saprospiraceae bacterium]
MYRLLKPLLFTLEPEKAHGFTVTQLQRLSKLPLASSIMQHYWNFRDPALEVEKMGLRFKNPVGLAAGFDKNGAYIDSMHHLGFGFLEVGTITPIAQPGNDKPRLFRLPDDQALINRMGFNNDGVHRLVENLKQVKTPGLIIGGNIGKNKNTPNEQAIEDYLICFRKLFDYVDYFVVNVSSPNTPGLRNLQEKEPLTQLLQVLQDENNQKAHRRPILLKIAPDLTQQQLDDVLVVVEDQQLDGIIATNTTLDRKGLKAPDSLLQKIGAGGLSGAPLTKMATQTIAYIRRHTKSSFTIIGVGGIMSADDAIEKLDNGADLIQIYTGLIFRGPCLPKEINQMIARRSTKRH